MTAVEAAQADIRGGVNGIVNEALFADLDIHLDHLRTQCEREMREKMMRLREAYLAHVPARGYHPEPTFVVAELVNDAGMVGAADLARLHAERTGEAAR